jgi:hypothetical protein
MGFLKLVWTISTWIAEGLASANYARIAVFVVTRILGGLIVCGAFLGGKEWAEEWVRRSVAKGAPTRPSGWEGHEPTTSETPWKVFAGVLIVSALLSLFLGQGLLTASDCSEAWSLAETEEGPATPAESHTDRFLKLFLILGIPAIFGVGLGREHGIGGPPLSQRVRHSEKGSVNHDG